MNEYPAWICGSCGNKYGSLLVNNGPVTFTPGQVCGWCGIEVACTDPKNFGYPPHPDRLKAKDTGQGELL